MATVCGICLCVCVGDAFCMHVCACVCLYMHHVFKYTTSIFVTSVIYDHWCLGIDCVWHSAGEGVFGIFGFRMRFLVCVCVHGAHGERNCYLSGKYGLCFC